MLFSNKICILSRFICYEPCKLKTKTVINYLYTFLKQGKGSCHVITLREGRMTHGSKLKKLLHKNSLPNDATPDEVLRALDVHSTEAEVDRSELYSRKCQTCADQEDVNSGYD